MFSAARVNGYGEHLRAGAGEVLGAYPIVRDFIETRRLERSRQVDSILKLFRVADLLRDTQALACVAAPCGVRVRTLADEMTAAIRDHLEAFKLAYGAECVRPKHHMLFHVPGQVLADAQLQWC